METEIKRRSIYCIIALTLTALAISIPLIHAAPVSNADIGQSSAEQGKDPSAENSPGARYVTIDFNDVDIATFIKFISDLTGKNFVVDNAVKGKVTIISPTKITIEEAFKVFESVLEVHGFTTIPSGNITKIVPALQARSKNIETLLRRESVTPEDKVVTQLIPLKYANPDTLKKLFAPFISKTSVIVSYPPTGMLIVTEVLSNINRLIKIIDAIDVEGIGEELSVVPIEHATASTLGASLNNVFQTGAKNAKSPAPVSKVKIVPDERTNTLIVLASEDDTIRIKQLIKLLDKEAPRSEGNIHVYYLQNANAEDLSKVLMAIPSKEAAATEKGKAPVVSKGVQIMADKATNSLVINAKKDDYLVLEGIIRKLDIPRRMVYIEALIMEVDTDKDFDLGVEWRAGNETGRYDQSKIGTFLGSGGSGTDGGYNLIPSISDNQISFPGGFSIGVIGAGIKIGSAVFPTLGAVIRAYQKDSDVNILSTPQILTTDNEEAQITVGENVPFLTRQDTSTGNSDRDYSTYEYKDVGVSLKITPQINQERFVRLKIFQEVKSLKEGTASYTPTTLTRTADTTVIVKDKNTVVIGGMIGETTDRGSYKVPVLGDIPVLGWLFRSNTSTHNKTNLFIFLTPHIIENPDEANEVYEEKKEYINQVEEGVISMYESKARPGTDMQLCDLGYRRLQAKDYDKAKEYYEKALAVNPDNPYAILNMGVIYQEKGEIDKAIDMYNRIISLNPVERAIRSTDSTQKGKTLADIARDNLSKIMQ